MIISDNGMVRLKGKQPEILADLTAAIHCAYEAIAENLGEEESRKLIVMATEDALKSPEELKAEIKELMKKKEQMLHEVVKDVANILFRGGM